MIQVNRIYLIFNRLVTKKFLVDTSDSVSSNKLKVISWQWEIYRSVEKLGYWKSVLFFISYAYKAFRKSLV